MKGTNYNLGNFASVTTATQAYDKKNLHMVENVLYHKSVT